MANTDLIAVGSKGFCYFGDLGSTAPTTPTSSWDPAFGDAGQILDEGLTEAVQEDETTFGAWGVNGPVRIEPKSRTVTFKLTLIELSARALSLYYSVPMADMTSVGSGPSQYLEFDDPATATAIYVALGLDIIDQVTGRQIRYVIPRARVSDRDNIDDKPESMHQFGLTITAMVPTTGGSPIKRFFTGVSLP